jgi:hypothetical protein
MALHVGGEECFPIRNGFPNQKGLVKMVETRSHVRGYILAAMLGALGGGIFVLFATKAIPKMMSQMMPEMMQNMMAQMRAKGCSPDI